MSKKCDCLQQISKKWLVVALLFMGILVLVCGISFFSHKKYVGEVVSPGRCDISYDSSLLNREAAEEAAQLLEDVFGRKPRVVEDRGVYSHYTLYLGGPELANQTGTNIDDLKENGYKAVVFMDSLYIYGKSKEGILRGVDAILRLSEGKETLNLTADILMDSGATGSASVYVGEENLESYVIVEASGKKEAQNAAQELQHYIVGAVGAYLPISKSASVGEEGAKQITLVVDDSLAEGTSGVSVSQGDIRIAACDKSELSKAVREFANQYLGWAFAGESKEHVMALSGTLRIPEELAVEENPWMEEREPIICLWKTNYSRGEYFSPNVQLQSELMTYSDDQLYEYVKMMKYCGYTGIQVTDMCSTWGAYGGYEFVQDRIRFMADAAHSLGMKFTLWVWGAEFEGYSWVDHSLSFYEDGVELAMDNPRAVETFDKYYSIYAQLADCCDRLIAHYSDPGVLNNSDDIGYFSNMLKEKFKAVNPAIDFGVNCYRDDINPVVLSQYLGNDVTYYTGAARTEDEDWSTFRAHCVNLNSRTGVWSWNLAEMEIDQLAEMNVNAELIKRVYQQSQAADQVLKPTYWSEMDSYHVLNLFSLYCSGQLLQNPEESPSYLLWEIATDVVGSQYGDVFYEVLDLIQDARTGDRWETFRWNYAEWIMTGEDYNAEDIWSRSTVLIPYLEEMIAADLDTGVVPLPVSVTELLQMILPHVKQIQQFAAFRINMKDLEALAAAGTDAETLSNKAAEIYTLIPEYNCIIGLWGQPEMIAQYRLMKNFCKEQGVKMPVNQSFDYLMTQRIYAEICEQQRINDEQVYYTLGSAWQFTNPYDSDDVERWLNMLVEDGLLQRMSSGEYYLTNWESYTYAF